MLDTLGGWEILKYFKLLKNNSKLLVIKKLKNNKKIYQIIRRCI